MVFVEEANSVSIVFDIVTEIRKIRSEFNIALNKLSKIGKLLIL